MSPLSHPDATADARRGEEDEQGWSNARDFEYDPDAQDTDIDVPQFPITHEITLKDHMKVISALTLDPSGARVLSGSHDYDCKLWDFGGMDARCRPFKTWEPAGNYHVSASPNSCTCRDADFIVRYTMSSIQMMGKNFLSSLVPLKPSCMTVMARRSMSVQSADEVHVDTSPSRRVTYIKGDPYIRDMKHTSCVARAALSVFAAYKDQSVEQRACQ